MRCGNVPCRRRPLCIDASDNGALAGVCARTRNVELRDGTVRSSHVAVIHTALVGVVSRERSRWSETFDTRNKGTLAGACARARNVEPSKSAGLSPEKAMDHVACVRVLSSDHSLRVDVLGQSALARACARARSVESGESLVWSPQKTVIHTARLDVGYRDRPCRGKSTDE